MAQRKPGSLTPRFKIIPEMQQPLPLNDYQITIKKIVGHAGAMTLTEKVYTHLDVKELIDAINKI